MPSDALKAPTVPVTAPRDEVDPELVALPDPPRGGRAAAVSLLAVTAVVCALMAGLLGADARYAFAPRVPTPVGDLAAVATADLEENRLVSATGSLGVAGAIRFERPLSAGTFRLMPVAGRRDLWVEVAMRDGQEGSRYVPKSEFVGRAVPLAKGGLRRRGMGAAVSAVTGVAVPADAWVIVDGEAPQDARVAVALASMFIAFAMWNLVQIARFLRRVG